MKPKVRFDEIPKYKKFVNDRDEALEAMLRNHRLKVTDMTDKTFTDAMSVLQAHYPAMQADPYNKLKIRRIDENLDHIFNSACHHICYEQILLRRAAYMLSNAGEAEAIAQTLGKPAAVKLGHNDVSQKVYRSLPDGTDLLKRMELYFADVRKKMMSAYEQAILFNDSTDEMMGRVFLALPKKRALSPKPVLKKVKKAKIAEAAKPKFTGDESGVTFDFGPKGGVTNSAWDQGSWDHTIQQSNEEYIAIDRGPDTFFDMKNPLTGQAVRTEIPEDEKIYGWELEQQMTHDFVSSVRDGQIDAANFAGINEFIWIAVLDQRTCEFCCEWRSGLLTSEIEKVLADDQDLADHCDVTVPPAHFNCRCGIAPVVIDLDKTEMPDTPTKDFQSWLDGE